MPDPIRTLVQDYGWIHLGIGLTGNALFAIGSVMFLPGLGEAQLPAFGTVEWRTFGVWLFIVGASFMFLGSLGSLLVSLYSKKDKGGAA